MPDSSVQQGFCRNCGKQARSDAAFCVSCGEPLSSPQQGADQVPESPSNTTGTGRRGITQSWDEVTEAVVSAVFAESWEECKRIVEERRDVLLTDAADEELAGLITSNRGEEETVEALEEHRVLLARCRHEGIDAAFSSYLQPSTIVRDTQAPDDEWNKTLDSVAEFVNAQSWVMSKLLLEQRRNLLLTDTADEVLSELIAQRRRDGDQDVRDLEGHRQLLTLCRQKGIDTAFAEYSQEKQSFLEWAKEWLIGIGIVILIFVIIGLFT